MGTGSNGRLWEMNMQVPPPLLGLSVRIKEYGKFEIKVESRIVELSQVSETRIKLKLKEFKRI